MEKKMKKTLWMVSSSKGGVGKTMFACAAFEYMKLLNAVTIAIDCDTASPKFSNFYGLKNEEGKYDANLNLNSENGILRVNVREFSEAEKIIDFAASDCDAMLLDLPGGMTSLKEIMGSNEDFVAEFKGLGYEDITMFFLIDPSMECAQSVRQAVDDWNIKETGMRLVAVRSGRSSAEDKFSFFDFDPKEPFADETGRPEEYLRLNGGLSIDMPHWRPEHYWQFDARKHTLGAIQKDINERSLNNLSRSGVVHIGRWLGNMIKTFEKLDNE